MTAADIACANSQPEVHQELLNSGAHQGSLIEPQVVLLTLIALVVTMTLREDTRLKLKSVEE